MHYLAFMICPILVTGLAIQGLNNLPTPVYARNASEAQLPSPVLKRSNLAPTPQPTGPASMITTVYINSATDFSLLAPKSSDESVADSENDAIAFCHPESSTPCDRTLPAGFITAAAVNAADDGSWIQITGCIDPRLFNVLSPMDTGGQYDVRYPNGAQCAFGGYGASFIQLLEPATNRFCLKCCKEENDQENCNSHNDRAGCDDAIPGTYDFPAIGVSCS